MLTRLDGRGFLRLRRTTCEGGKGGEEFTVVCLEVVNESINSGGVCIGSEIFAGSGDAFEEVDKADFRVLGLGGCGGDGGCVEEVVDVIEQVNAARLKSARSGSCKLAFSDIMMNSRIRPSATSVRELGEGVRRGYTTDATREMRLLRADLRNEWRQFVALNPASPSENYRPSFSKRPSFSDLVRTPQVYHVSFALTRMEKRMRMEGENWRSLHDNV